VSCQNVTNVIKVHLRSDRGTNFNGAGQLSRCIEFALHAAAGVRVHIGAEIFFASRLYVRKRLKRKKSVREPKLLTVFARLAG